MQERDRLIGMVEQAIADGCGRCGRTLSPCSDCANMDVYSRFSPIAERVVGALFPQLEASISLKLTYTYYGDGERTVHARAT